MKAVARQPGSALLVVVGLVATLLLFFLSSRPGPAPEGVIRLEQGWRLTEPGRIRPATTDPRWEPIALPDNWSRSRPGAGGRLWYRFAFRLKQRPSEVWGIYIPRVSQNAAFYLNGTPLGDGGRMVEPYAVNWHRPQLVSVPPAVLHSGENHLWVEVVGYANSGAGLSRLEVGPMTLIEPRHFLRDFLQVGVATVATVVMVLLALLGVLLWLFRRQEAVYRWFFLGALAGSLVVFAYLNRLPASFHLSQWVHHSAVGFYIYFMLPFSNRYRGIGPSRAEHIALGYVAVGSGVTLFVPAVWQFPAIALWHVGNAFLGSYVVWRLYQGLSQRPDPGLAALFVVLFIGLLLGLHDEAVFLLHLEYVRPQLFPFEPPLLLLAIATDLLRRFFRALHEAEALNSQLNARVAENRRELECSYRGLAELRRQQAISHERERIMRELHDGLGGHLTAALAYSEKSSSTYPVRDILAQALSELRLMIDSLDVEPEDFTTLLALLRERIEPVLESHGVRLEWSLEEEPSSHGLDREAMLHVARILQEAFTNAARHAGASRVQLLTGPSSIAVIDNGSGFDPAAAPPGRGLENMRKRASLAGVALKLDSGPNGTALRLAFPGEKASTASLAYLQHHRIR